MREIVETFDSCDRIGQSTVGTAERICTKLSRKTCLVLRSDEFECQRSKVKVTRNKNALCTHNTAAVWREWNGLVADNVAQAADAMIRSLQRVTSLACVH